MRELRRQVNYTSAWGAARLVIADRWYPSSKTCSDCGAVKAKLPLRVRVYNCDECGFVLDRDLNAARNLVALVGRANATPQGDGYRGGADRRPLTSQVTEGGNWW